MATHAYGKSLSVMLLAGLAVAFSLCLTAPAPVLGLLPLTVAAPELAPWLLLFDVLGGVVAALVYPRMAPLFVVTAMTAAWPMWQAGSGAWLGGPARVSVASRQLPLGMRYYAPAVDGVRPVIVDIHGGGWQHGNALSDDRFNSYMAHAGYAVFALEYRLAPAFHFPAQLEDVRAALAYVRQHAAEYRADPGRIILCGRSAGAQLALLAAYAPDLPGVRGVISFYGPTDLTLGYRDLPWPDPLGVRAVLEAYVGGTPAQAGPLYARASPVNAVRPGLPPTLLLQGGRDHIVKPEFARELRERLQASGDDVALVELPWSEHAFDAVWGGMGNRLALREVDRFAGRVAR